MTTKDSYTSVKVRFGDHMTTIYYYGDQTFHWLVTNALERYYLIGSKIFDKLEKYLEVKVEKESPKLGIYVEKLFNKEKEEQEIQILFKEKPRTWNEPLKDEEFFIREKKIVYMDGCSLNCEDLMELGYGRSAIKLTKEAEEKVVQARKFVDEEIVAKNRVTYGVNTGFGKFANTVIPSKDLDLLQYNLIVQSAAGVGEPLSHERTRRLLALRINVLSKGFSGISPQVLTQYIDAFNASCLSWVPEQGTVGASGDLCPLAHLALGLLGEGQMWSPQTGLGNALQVLQAKGFKPIKLGAKEGLALINGTQFITALGVEALMRSERVARQADVVACVTLEALMGTNRAFDRDLQILRPHPGQGLVASRLINLLHTKEHPSQINESHKNCGRVQDPYTLRCIPQVHGITNDTLAFVRGILQTEMNSATDNPIILAERGDVVSGGNFHGEYPAKALDYLAIAIHELSNMSERRVERLLNPAYSGMDAFLTANGGLNSGFMIAQYTAAALVSENKTLCHPSSVDSISTCAGTEDHVSMGGWSARKALRVVANVEEVIGVELLCACEGLDIRKPLLTTLPLQKVHKLVRTCVKPWDKDRYLAPDMHSVTELLRTNKVWEEVKDYIKEY